MDGRSAAAPPGTCVVIGVGRKLGLSVARRFGREGHPVALMARRRSRLEEFGRDLGQDGIRWAAFEADASQTDEVVAAVATARSSLGPVQVLVYNAAALNTPSLPSEMSLDLFYSTLRVNLVSALVATQLVVPDMRQLGTGTVLFTGGTWGLVPSAAYSAVGMGKAALRNLAFSFAEELAPDGIHVATVTISGVIKAGTDFDPDRLADLYWDVHCQPPDAWEREVRY